MYARRLIYAGALVAAVGLTDPAMAQTPSEDFKFNYDSAYGQNGLSQPFAGPNVTGQSYGTGVAINASDPSQKVYTLVEANPDICAGGQRGAFPASSRTLPASSTPAYLGPYYIVRRTVDGAIDTTFGLAATSASSRPAPTPATHSPVCASIPAPATSSSSGRK